MRNYADFVPPTMPSRWIDQAEEIAQPTLNKSPDTIIMELVQVKAKFLLLLFGNIDCQNLELVHFKV